MKRKKEKMSFTGWTYIGVFVILAGLCAGAAALAGKNGRTDTETQMPDLLRKEGQQIVEFELSVTPVPTRRPVEQPSLPEGAVDLWFGEKPTGITVSSEAEAMTLLNDYLEECMNRIPERERIMSAGYDGALSLYDANANGTLMTGEEALELLMENPGLLPVRIVTEKRVRTAVTPGTETVKNANLAKGSRIVKQLGRSGIQVAVETKEYLSGTCVSVKSSEPANLFESLPTRIEEGTYLSKEPDKEPGKKEGSRFKDPEGLKLILPVQQKISSYFGTRYGVMHNGIDIPAKAGTAIKAPAEGLIVYVGARGEYGTVIDIDHGNGFVSRLTHCDNVQVKLNQRVFSGEQIAVLAENEKGEEKPHLHYELLIDGVPANPLYYLES